MGEFFLAFVIFAVVVIVTAILFGGWVLIKVAHGLGALLGIGPRRDSALSPVRQAKVGGREAMQCRVPGCGHFNPTGARFCRHCGHAFPRMQTLAA